MSEALACDTGRPGTANHLRLSVLVDQLNAPARGDDAGWRGRYKQLSQLLKGNNGTEPSRVGRE